MDKLTNLPNQASVLRADIRAAHAALRTHERKALALRSSLRRCQQVLTTLRRLLTP